MTKRLNNSKNNSKNESLILKADMHLHTSEDLEDYPTIKYNVFELIDYLSINKFNVFSVTMHNYMFDEEKMLKVRKYAKSKGLVMIPGIEKTIENNHILIYNMNKVDAEKISTYKLLATISAKYHADRILIIAAHPFYPSKTAIRKNFYKYHKLLDGLEINSFYLKLPALNFNLKGLKEAREHNMITIGNTDAHLLSQIGTTYTNIKIWVKNSKSKSNIRNTVEFQKFVRRCSDKEYFGLIDKIILQIKKREIEIVTKPLKVSYMIKASMKLFP